MATEVLKLPAVRASDPEHRVRLALALAGVDAVTRRRVLDELARRLDDRATAVARRDAAIRDAHRIVGSPRQLAEQLHDFYARAWPYQRDLIAPPDDATPLRAAYFRACQGAEDAGTDLPKLRQLRNIILCNRSADIAHRRAETENSTTPGE